MDSVIDAQIVLHQVGKVIVKRFGEDGKRLIDVPLTFDDDIRQMLAKMSGIPAVINGDRAMLKDDPEPQLGREPSMIKVGGQWKLDETRFLSGAPYDRDKFMAQSKARSALLQQWSKKIEEGAYKDVDEAKAGLALLEVAASKSATTAPATSLPANRWRDKASGPNLTALQKAAYEQIAQLQDCNLQQKSIPGAPSLESPAPGTPDATVKLLRMGLDVVPVLAEALDDTASTKTSPLQRSSNDPKSVWTVNLVVTQLIRRICSHNFVIGKEPQTHILSEVVEHPELAPQFQKAILAWYESHRNQTEVERQIDEVADDYFRNRLDAVEYLGRNKVVKAGPAISKDIDRTLAAIEKQNDSLKAAEISECAFALGQIGDKGNLAEVQRVCQRFSAVWDQRQRPSGSTDIGNLFQAYHAMAMLGRKEAAIKELTRLFDSYHSEMEAMSSQEFKSNLDKTSAW